MEGRTTDRMVRCPLCEQLILIESSGDSPPPAGWIFRCLKCDYELELQGAGGMPGVRIVGPPRKEPQP